MTLGTDWINSATAWFLGKTPTTVAQQGWISNIIYARHVCVCACAEDSKPALLAAHLPWRLPQQMVSSSQDDNHKLNLHRNKDKHKETGQFWRGTVAVAAVWAWERPNAAVSCPGPSLSTADVRARDRRAARAALLCYTGFHLEKSFKKVVLILLGLFGFFLNQSRHHATLSLWNQHEPSCQALSLPLGRQKTQLPL